MFEGTVSGNKYRDKNESYDGVRASANAASDREENKKAMDDLVAKAEGNGGTWSSSEDNNDEEQSKPQYPQRQYDENGTAIPSSH
jgi:hypothetical protein